MDKKVVEWNWDRETSRFLLKGLFDIVKETAKRSGKQRVLDLGGLKGSLAKKVHADLSVCIDLEPKKRYDELEYIRGDIRELPFKDRSFDLVLAKAVLHHVPDELDDTLEGIHRVMKDGGYLVVEEPLSKNPLSKTAGKLFTTTIHDEDERPLEPELLLSTLKKYFSCQEVKMFFLTTYLMPHIIPRLPEPLKPSFRNLTKLMHEFDEYVISNSKYLAGKCSYMAVVLKK